MLHRVSCEIGGRTLTLESGKLAKQANGSVYVSYGDTRVLVTACSSLEAREGIDFFPLTVEFAEKFYAAGKIPGSFPRREGRPTQEAILSARMTDRQLRPLFPEGYYFETQIVITVLSADPEADLDVAAAAGASAALHISNIPFMGPTAACRVGKMQGEYVVNPSWTQIEQGQTEMDILVAGTQDAIMMVEGGAREASEKEVLQAILTGHEEIKKIVHAIEELRSLCGQPKRAFQPVHIETSLEAQVKAQTENTLRACLREQDKQTRVQKIAQAKKEAVSALVPIDLLQTQPEEAKKKTSQVKTLFENFLYQLMRDMILNEKNRIDGRTLTQVRPISVESGFLPRTHGSALFTRGETQVLSTVTLGTSDDEQIVDTIFKKGTKRFMLHYNFPPFSVGEVGRMTGQNRREIGHGALAERSIQAMMPPYEKFPYTVRIVCETLESNGSSSMGSVCSTSMALMDAGAPFVKPVAGIAMGLIKEGDQVAVLSDILGDEDHLGDMDFKVAGTREGITGIQMDIKIQGVNEAILSRALAQAKEGRIHILNEMAKGIEQPKEDLSTFAPRITTLFIPIDKIREVIGSGGKVIKEIIAQTGCKIDITDDGKINIASNDSEASQRAITIIQGIIAEAEVGKIYQGIVKKIVEFGAFVGILPNQDGLLHISEIAHERVHHVLDYLKEGDQVEVKVIEVDRAGKVRLSRKILLPPPVGQEPSSDREGFPDAVTPPRRPFSRDHHQRGGSNRDGGNSGRRRS